jgi:Zn-dependent protease
MIFRGLTVAQFLARIIALLVAITVHEFAHAWMANRLGDRTATDQGRLSLNPIRHLDLMGSLMLLTAGFGWGRPVPVNPYNLKNGPRAGMAWTSVAGPVSNLLMAAIVSALLRFNLVPLDAWRGNSIIPGVAELLFTIIILNIGLAIFNLIPIPPLDGFKVLLGVLPRTWAIALLPLEQYGMFLLLGLFAIGWVLPVDPLGAIMNPAFDFFLGVFLGI